MEVVAGHPPVARMRTVSGGSEECIGSSHGNIS